MTQPIPIVGAGIAGLTLARCLLHTGIRTTLYEKASTSPRHNYAITLHASSYRPLLMYLGVEERLFKSAVAVDADVGGTGRIDHVANSDESMRDSFRANRARLEGWLGEGLDIRYSSAVKTIETAISSQGPKLHFANGEMVTRGLVVAADGVHSTIRKVVLSSTDVQVLPLVALNGKRRVDRRTFDKLFAQPLKDNNVLQANYGDTLLNISLNERKEEYVSISWVFSRLPRRGNDALHRPERSNVDAQEIPDEFFQEIAALKNLEQPFAEVFDPEKLRKDRVLHWLMRKTLTPLVELQNVLDKNRVVLLGDAAHAEPIIGGNGANVAILDGVEFAKGIASEQLDRIFKAYEARFMEWERESVECEVRIKELHEEESRNSASL
ncbi:hypothetical protein NX059_011804 [Plenodomus lindquistii]|nr:hypothetical protein NX059_011804 [Plenodomus lindquistii]